MNAHELVTHLLEDEDIDWTPDPTDPDESTNVDSLRRYWLVIDGHGRYFKAHVRPHPLRGPSTPAGGYWMHRAADGTAPEYASRWYDGELAAEIARQLGAYAVPFVSSVRESEEDVDWTPDPADPDASTALASSIPSFKEVHVVGRRWYRRGAGGVYCTVDIYIDGEKKTTLPMGYGYGDHYQTRAMEWMKERGYIPPAYASSCALWHIAEKMGFKYTHDVYDVKRQRDL